MQRSAAAFLELVGGRQGHFRLESGHHSGLWLDLDGLFSEPRRVEPFVTGLTEALRPYGVTSVCGPLLGGAFLAQLLAQALDADFCFAERELPATATGLYQVRHRIPAALTARMAGRRFAIVDDVMSAGSALRGTHTELEAYGAKCVVAGALLLLGSVGESFFTQRGIPVVAVARQDYDLWEPTVCPRCAAGEPLEETSY